MLEPCALLQRLYELQQLLDDLVSQPRWAALTLAHLCYMLSPCLSWPHMDHDALRLLQADRTGRKAIAPNELASAFMGGRHTVDSNEPDVQHLAQWSMGHVDDWARWLQGHEEGGAVARDQGGEAADDGA